MINIKFEYPVRGQGRPQVVLIGNGLERKSGQVAWNSLVDNLTVKNCIPISDEEREKVPFPLLYESLVQGQPIPRMLDRISISNEEKRLKEEMSHLVSMSNDLLDNLPTLKADHIFTTNYSYCLEKAFFPRSNFYNDESRSSVRFNLLPLNNDGKQKQEREYFLHSGYYSEKRNTALWHIHGEASVPKGIVLGHDRYGRLLKRIIESCEAIDFKTITKKGARYSFTSWPEIFIFGDVYVIGFGFLQCEFDLWWLLKRKQRERHGDGTVYFYDIHRTVKELLPTDCCAPEDMESIRKMNDDIKRHNRNVQNYDLNKKLLAAHGVQIMDLGSSNETEYDEFYMKAFDDVRSKIEASRI